MGEMLAPRFIRCAVINKNNEGNPPETATPTRIWGQFHTESGETGVPFWFLSIATVSIGAIPWWIRTPQRFSLRTLLIVMTLLAVGLGLAVFVLR
jgi:hypothetical protein